jgi:Uncharacterized conserved protein (DUF2039)
VVSLQWVTDGKISFYFYASRAEYSTLSPFSLSYPIYHVWDNDPGFVVTGTHPATSYKLSSLNGLTEFKTLVTLVKQFKVKIQVFMEEGNSVRRSRPQAHQNETAFRHNKNSKKTRKILETVNTGGLCERCAEKIEWRKKYRKYKPLSQPRKCNGCGNRTVKAAYRTLCDDCARTKRACPQCAEQKDVGPKIQTRAEEAREQEFLEGVVESLRERDRRTVYRKVARGEDVLAHLVDENGQREGSEHEREISENVSSSSSDNEVEREESGSESA